MADAMPIFASAFKGACGLAMRKRRQHDYLRYSIAVESDHSSKSLH
ncbi:hypothetical protein [Sphingomonas sp. PP-CE-1A-559]|nr:hypothetical protein [Sphingomonas sp. PP-CE-1A-559]